MFAADYFKIYAPNSHWILQIESLESSEIAASLNLDMDSIHRNVSISMSYIQSKEAWKLRARSFNGWKSILDAFGTAAAYQSYLQKFRNECPPTSLREFGHIAVQAAGQSGASLQGVVGFT